MVVVWLVLEIVSLIIIIFKSSFIMIVLSNTVVLSILERIHAMPLPLPGP